MSKAAAFNSHPLASRSAGVTDGPAFDVNVLAQ